MQFGPISRIPWSRQTARRLALAFPPFVTGFGKARRDDDQGSDALLSAQPGRLDHRVRRDHDDGEVDRPRDGPDRRKRQDRLNDLGLRIHGIDRPVEPGGYEVVEDLTADGAPRPRGTDHGHRPRRQEVAHGGRGGDLLAALEALQGVFGQRSRELHEDLPGLSTDLDRESALPEDLDHPGIRRQDPRLEDGDTVLGGCLGQVAEQNRPQP